MRKLLLAVALLSVILSTPAQSGWISPWGENPAEPKISILRSDHHSLELEIILEGFFSSPVESEEGNFQRLSFASNEAASTMKIGAPQIPQIVRLIQIPRGARPAVKSIIGESFEIEGYRIHPFQKPLKEGEVALEFACDEAEYQSPTLLPDRLAEISESGVWRHLQVAALRISPMQYNPASGTLKVYRSLKVTVEFAADSKTIFQFPTTGIPPVFDRMYRKTALNYHPEWSNIGGTDEEVGIKYLIICPEEALPYIAPLAELRNAQGYRTSIATISPAFRTPQDFKAEITSLYLSDGLEYVLMVGDANLSNPVCPMYYWNYDPSNPSYSDSWYTCVVPGGDSDHLPELAIGRLVYNTPAQLQHQVDKIMDYLFTYDDSRDWFEKSLLVAHGENYPLKYTQCKEEIRTAGYSLQTPVFSTIYGGAGGSNIDIVNFINGSSCGLFNYRGHGSETNWPQWSGWTSFTATQVYAMTNQHRLFVLFDICCSNGDIVTYSGECLTETFMKADYAATAVLSAINPSYTDPNHVYDKELYNAVFDDGVNNIGYASNAASVIVNSQFGIYGQANYRMYYWQGDPALDIWTHIPEIAEVEAPGSIDLGQSETEVSVALSGIPFPNALVCIQNEEIYAVGYTDAAGIAYLQFDPLPLTPGEAVLTVSGHNLAIWQDTLSISGGFGSIVGMVSSNQSGAPLGGALVSLPYLSLEEVTDSLGNYQFSGIPSLSYEITASCEGYIDSTQIAIVDSGEVCQLDFNLLHAECTPGVDSIFAVIEQGETLEYDFQIANGGDYPLEFAIIVTGDSADATLQEKMNFDPSTATDDEEIRGIAFDGEFFWLAGAGTAESNFLYKFDSEGVYVGTLPQPQTVTTQGFSEICWEGEYYYGIENGVIIKFDSLGTALESINSGVASASAITSDFSGEYFYIGGGIGNIYKMNSSGAIVRIYGNNLNVRGLCWRADDPEGYNLYILSNEPAVTVSKMNVVNGAKITLGVIEDAPAGSAGGCWLSNDIDPQYVLLTGIIQLEGIDEVEGWQIAKSFDWVIVSPDSGVVPPGGSCDITAWFDAQNYFPGIYQSHLQINHNAYGGVTEIPVQLTLNPSGISFPESETRAPQKFALKQNQPNPFNAQTVITFAIPSSSKVKLMIFDVLGRMVNIEELGRFEPGEYNYVFDGKRLASGIYFCRIEAGDFRSSIKLVLLK